MSNVYCLLSTVYGMKMRSFEDLEVWQKSCRLCVDVYRQLSCCRDYSLKDQICRAAVSVASNIAEGSERGSDKDFIRFLKIALGSAAELRTQLYIAAEVEVIPKVKSKEYIERIKVISRMLQGLVTSLEKSCAINK